MADYLSRSIDLGPNAEGLKQAGDATAVAAVVSKNETGTRRAVIVQVDPASKHAVRVALGDRDASARHAAQTLRPGDAIDTTDMAADLQPTGQITAYTDATLDLSGDGDPGRLWLLVTEIS